MNIKQLLLTGITALTIVSCAKDEVEYNVVGNALPIILAEHAQSFIDMKALEAELDSVYDVLAQRNAEIVDLKLDIENYIEVVGELNSEIEVLTLLVADLEATVAQQEADIIVLQDLNLDLEDQNSKLIAANDELSQLNGALQSDVDAKNKEIDALRKHVEALVAQINELTTIISNRDTEIVELEGDIKTITEVVDNSVQEVTDLLTHTFDENPFYYATTKFVFVSQDTNISGVTFIRYESQANGSLTVKFRGDDRVGHTAVNVDWIQVREDQATNFKRFSGNNIDINEINVETFATDYIAEIIVDDTLENTSAEDIAKLFTGNEPSTIVVNNVMLTLDVDGLFSADGVRLRFVAPNVQNIIVGVITGEGTTTIRYNGVADGDDAYLNAAINFLANVQF